MELFYLENHNGNIQRWTQYYLQDIIDIQSFR